MELIKVNGQDQLDKCLRLRKEVFVAEQNVPEELEIDEYDIPGGECAHLLLTDEGIPVATARVKHYDAETAKIQRVAVARERRGQGLGKRIMEGAERLADRLGYRYAILDAQVQAEPFYGRLGYVTISDEPFDDAGIQHVRMRKQLSGN
ncbi:GNAT family N-acetyltransferase [Paenibacillus ginsengarvi]|uniref:GNAT family N-acetyltransferase n=1 Tax=Paenibacillus ginsengarvi TaxID=400777 RepID=A0A3B0CM17_9BACL|nr:GNAT family N-acetyltransferase [Paenibacillus ginsengarvi]RKN86715.1 GNAT family N-acetyltransferase [Paenibacillus ginsengarvi]